MFGNLAIARAGGRVFWSGIRFTASASLIGDALEIPTRLLASDDDAVEIGFAARIAAAYRFFSGERNHEEYAARVNARFYPLHLWRSNDDLRFYGVGSFVRAEILRLSLDKQAETTRKEYVKTPEDAAREARSAATDREFFIRCGFAAPIIDDEYSDDFAFAFRALGFIPVFRRNGVVLISSREPRMAWMFSERRASPINDVLFAVFGDGGEAFVDDFEEATPSNRSRVLKARENGAPSFRAPIGEIVAFGNDAYLLTDDRIVDLTTSSLPFDRRPIDVDIAPIVLR